MNTDTDVVLIEIEAEDTISINLNEGDGPTVPGAPGANGWSAVTAAVVDGERRVLRVVDWIGGTGAKPAAGYYLGAAGPVDAIADAIDIRGTAGGKGDGGTNGWSEVTAVVADGERRVLQVVDWIGGSGTKPAAGFYISAAGPVDAIAAGTDIRGVPGAKGDKGDKGDAGTGGGVPYFSFNDDAAMSQGHPLSLSGNTGLLFVNIVGTYFTSYDLSECPSLIGVNVQNIGADTTVDLTGNSALRVLSITSNQYDVQLVTTGCTALETVEAGNAAYITAFDFTDSPLITSLDLGPFAGIETIDLTLLTNLENVNLGGDRDHPTCLSIEINNLVALKHMYIYGFPLVTEIDLTGLTSVTEATFDTIPLSTLGVAAMPALQIFEWHANGPATALDMSLNVAITSIVVNIGTLEAVTMPVNASDLLFVDFSGNALSQAAVDAVLIALNSYGSSGGQCLLNGGTNAAASATGQAAEISLMGKGWQIYTNG